MEARWPQALGERPFGSTIEGLLGGEGSFGSCPEARGLGSLRPGKPEAWEAWDIGSVAW